MKIGYFFYKFSIFIYISFVIILCALYVNAYLSPSIDLKSSGNIYIYDNEEQLVYQGSTSSQWIDLENISPYIIDAVISVEDKNFYTHSGFDYVRIASALINNISTGTIVEGASTITQQYAKNMYLDFEQTLERKIDEVFLTLELEVHYDKDEILEGYLNTIYYGHGCYGIENASKYYFNKSASEVTLEEALILAGIPKSPNAYNPVTDYETSVDRALIVASTMVDNNLMTETEYNNLFINDVEIYGTNTENNLQMLMYYQDAVLSELSSLDEIPTSLIETGGLKIYTTLDMDAQTILEENILEYLPNDEVQVSSVIAEPNTGAVLALTGGVDYSTSTYNRALYSQRQVGSTMKAFLYYAALENNMTSSSTFTSEETTFFLSNDVTYSPNNYGDYYADKAITMAAAIAMSDNIYAVKTNLFLGVESMIEVARTTGVTGNLEEVTSLALGTSELNILDITTGYNTFASYGYQHDLYFIERIEDLEGNILYEKKIDDNLVLNQNYVYILNDLLVGTTDSIFTDYTTATGLAISSKLTNTYSYKSGTTDYDVWNIGYNNELIMSIWMGYDDNLAVTSDLNYAVKNIWADTMEEVLDEVECEWYEKPENVVSLMLDAITGEYTNDPTKATIFYYVSGSEPTYASYVFDNN